MRTALVIKAALFVAAGALVVLAEPAMALCKYKAADGSWTYGQNCARMTNQEIEGSGNAVIRQNEALKKQPPRIEEHRLKGYDYSTGKKGGMQIRMADPGKTPPPAGYTTQ
ncbi:MAG: hypothetical protein R3286_03820 [Gammaproteobacteria bacterium]|nr:hypothetical protein [Gammaproteobacteria bacterium]